MRTNTRSYEKVADKYAEFNYLSPERAIIRSKLVELKEVKAGMKVLFAGSGPGEDCLAAVMQGADVTCIDLSSRMLQIAADKIKERKMSARFIQGNVMDHKEDYDLVIANYFLNIFERPTMRLVLGHLASLVKPGGLLMISDVTPLGGSVFSRLIQYFYFLPVNAMFAAAHLCAWHIPYDYARYFPELGLTLKWQESFKDTKFGPMRYKTWAAHKFR